MAVVLCVLSFFLPAPWLSSQMHLICKGAALTSLAFLIFRQKWPLCVACGGIPPRAVERVAAATVTCPLASGRHQGLHLSEVL